MRLRDEAALLEPQRLSFDIRVAIAGVVVNGIGVVVNVGGRVEGLGFRVCGLLTLIFSRWRPGETVYLEVAHWIG